MGLNLWKLADRNGSNRQSSSTVDLVPKPELKDVNGRVIGREYQFDMYARYYSLRHSIYNDVTDSARQVLNQKALAARATSRNGSVSPVEYTPTDLFPLREGFKGLSDYKYFVASPRDKYFYYKQILDSQAPEGKAAALKSRLIQIERHALFLALCGGVVSAPNAQGLYLSAFGIIAAIIPGGQLVGAMTSIMGALVNASEKQYITETLGEIQTDMLDLTREAETIATSLKKYEQGDGGDLGKPRSGLFTQNWVIAGVIGAFLLGKHLRRR